MARTTQLTFARSHYAVYQQAKSNLADYTIQIGDHLRLMKHLMEHATTEECMITGLLKSASMKKQLQPKDDHDHEQLRELRHWAAGGDTENLAQQVFDYVSPWSHLAVHGQGRFMWIDSPAAKAAQGESEKKTAGGHSGKQASIGHSEEKAASSPSGPSGPSGEQVVAHSSEEKPGLPGSPGPRSS